MPLVSAVALRSSSHSNNCGRKVNHLGIPVALRSSSHSNEFVYREAKRLIRVALRSSSHSNKQMIDEAKDWQESCTPLFIAFKQSGLLRSFSKRGEHTASERGMHLEC